LYIFERFESEIEYIIVDKEKMIKKNEIIILTLDLKIKFSEKNKIKKGKTNKTCLLATKGANNTIKIGIDTIK
tara:strand:+ start:1448 stop:1666 length:219 start_codon:yes stop_codon:yes gene_type:complete